MAATPPRGQNHSARAEISMVLGRPERRHVQSLCRQGKRRPFTPSVASLGEFLARMICCTPMRGANCMRRQPNRDGVGHRSVFARRRRIGRSDMETPCRQRLLCNRHHQPAASSAAVRALSSPLPSPLTLRLRRFKTGVTFFARGRSVEAKTSGAVAIVPTIGKSKQRIALESSAAEVFLLCQRAGASPTRTGRVT